MTNNKVTLADGMNQIVFDAMVEECGRLKSQIAMLHKALTSLLEDYRDSRTYLGKWEWKYKDAWDADEVRAVAALTTTVDDVEAWEKQRRDAVLESAAVACDGTEAWMSAAFVKANEGREGKEKIDYIEGMERGASKCADAIRDLKSKP